ncbi:hypothetical protein [Streptomyces sp. NPDC057582]|uniref:hypothetical protein n=1 Tax=Streptomyces sp. NPDC057582 TaxID=3346174 RepID=UPI0036B7E3BD
MPFTKTLPLSVSRTEAMPEFMPPRTVTAWSKAPVLSATIWRMSAGSCSKGIRNMDTRCSSGARG